MCRQTRCTFAGILKRPKRLFCELRIIERSQYAEAVEANSARVEGAYNIYQKRQQIIEHIFGTLKRQWGYDHILMKGLPKNQGEFGLIFLTYNLRRVFGILGIEELKKRLKRVFSAIRLLLCAVHRILLTVSNPLYSPQGCAL